MRRRTDQGRWLRDALPLSFAVFVCFGAALLAAPFAQRAAAQQVPFTGVVVEDDVTVRAGAGRAYYKVGELAKGTSVRVEEVIFGWNRIAAPDGVFSYISKAFVDARGDGQVGVVNSNRIEVTAANVQGPGQSYRGQVVLNKGDKVRIVGESGSFYRIRPPSNAFVFLPPGAVQRSDSPEAIAAREAQQQQQQEQQQNQNENQDQAQATADTATDTADTADTSTDNTSTDSAAETDASDSQEQQPTPPADQVDATNVPVGEANQDTTADTETPASDSGTDSTAAQNNTSASAADTAQDNTEDTASDTATSETPAPADNTTSEAATDIDRDTGSSDVPISKGGAAAQTAAETDALQQVERKNLPLFMKPLEDQPIDQMLADYRGLQENASEMPAVDRRIIQLRLAALKRNQQLKQTLSEVAEARAAAAASEAQQASRSEQPAPGLSREDYDAVGRLLASGVYDGETLPRLFRLVDPSSGRTLAYIEPGEPVQAGQQLGQVVGIIGDKRYDQAMKLSIIEVERVDLLRAAQ